MTNTQKMTTGSFGEKWGWILYSEGSLLTRKDDIKPNSNEDFRIFKHSNKLQHCLILAPKFLR